MSLSGAGQLGPPRPHDPSPSDGAGAAGPRRHAWHPPTALTGDPISEGKLLIRNTLTGRKEPFVPLHRRHVKWYTCGPTVYDSAHVGHARTYLSFDIMRRIMSDYFHYNVLFQINTTDIDDKIVLRARQEYLFGQLERDEAGAGLDDVVRMAREALDEARVGAADKTSRIESDLADTLSRSDSRARAEHEALLDAQKVKNGNLERDAVAIEEAIAAAIAASASGDATKKEKEKDDARSDVLRASRSVLSEKLDRERGHTVTDKAIFDKHARKYEREFMSDMDALGIRRPDVLTRVTEYVPQIVDFVKGLVDDGCAYVGASGSVYQSLDVFRERGGRYRKLNPAGAVGGGCGADGVDGNAEEEAEAVTSAAEMAEGEGALSSVGGGGGGTSEKRNPNDFALWKASKPGEPAWDSPWGPGRPGWHIECSVVAGHILGTNLDLHSGGEDLKFPHHDNELAQSEAKFRCDQWVNYFTHTGHLHIEGLKMSKSLKNFVTIQQALGNNTARQLRIMFLLQAWDQPMNYSDQTVDDARTKEKTFKSFFREAEALCRKDYLSDAVGWRMENDADRALADSYLNARQAVHERLLDNFDTKGAMSALLDVIGEANAYLRTPGAEPSVLLIRALATYITQILRVFGVVDGSDDFGFGGAASSSSGGAGGEGGAVVSEEAAAEPFIDTMVSFREQVRNIALEAVSNKGGGGGGGDSVDLSSAIRSILSACDNLRDEVLPTLGVRLEDRPTGTRWNREDPDDMMSELAMKKAKELEMRVSKLEKQLAAKRKEYDKMKDSLVSPKELFRTREYKEWDEAGVPMVQADGEPVSAGQQKKKKKAIEKQSKAYDDLMTKSGGKPEELLDSTKKAMEEMEAELAKLSVG